jgi:endonuclease YncB( thermonuclease family)
MIVNEIRKLANLKNASILCAAAFLLFLFLGREISAIIVGILGLLISPRLRSVLDRYSFGPTRRELAIVVTAPALLISLLYGPAKVSTAPPMRSGVGEVSSARLPAAARVMEMQPTTPEMHEPGLPLDPEITENLTGCFAVDGDTLRCGDERIRLLGIDAPELEGHCAPGRSCVMGDPEASKSSLQAFSSGLIRVQRLGRDHYGRTLAHVYVSNINLACHQVIAGYAKYVREWDDQGKLRNECPMAPSTSLIY